MFVSKRIFVLSFAVLIFLSACMPTTTDTRDPIFPVADYSAEVATEWFDLQLKLLENAGGYSPPVAARVLGYSGLTLYESLVYGMPDYQSLSGQLTNFEVDVSVDDAQYYAPLVANAALASISRYLFPDASEDLMAEITKLEMDFVVSFSDDVSRGLLERSNFYGNDIAQAVFDYAKTDGGHNAHLTNFYDDYIPPDIPEVWMPTPPNQDPALQPYWGQNRPFVLSSSDVCEVDAPPTYSETPGSAFFAAAMEVYDAVEGITAEQNDIAVFWADDPEVSMTPAGHSVGILSQVLREQEATLEQTAHAYVMLGMALSDSFVSAWQSKYTYALVRPITYLREHVDANWDTPMVTEPVWTPPFPEYTSGHSVQAASFAVVMTQLFGDDYAFLDRVNDYRGYTSRSFSSFWHAAEENAISRLYGGVHYQFAINQGLEQGRCVANYVLDLEFHP